jgi:hypothetical protein
MEDNNTQFFILFFFRSLSLTHFGWGNKMNGIKGECCLKFNDPSLPMFDVVVVFGAITGMYRRYSFVELSDVSSKMRERFT